LVQNPTYVNSIDITGRTQGAMKEAFISLEKAAFLQISLEKKTKYMPIT
jgi:hypothetical protein